MLALVASAPHLNFRLSSKFRAHLGKMFLSFLLNLGFLLNLIFFTTLPPPPLKGDINGMSPLGCKRHVSQRYRQRQTERLTHQKPVMQLKIIYNSLTKIVIIPIPKSTRFILSQTNFSVKM